MDVADYGVAAALWSAVYLDGKLYDETGVPGSAWKQLNTEPKTIKWWSDPIFDDSMWFAANVSRCDDMAPLWKAMTSKWQDIAPDSRAKAVWYPNCKSVGTAASYLHNYFRLKVSVPVAQTPIDNPNFLLAYPDLPVCEEEGIVEDYFECDSESDSFRFLDDDDEGICQEQEISEDEFDCDVPYEVNTDTGRVTQPGVSNNSTTITTTPNETCSEPEIQEDDFSCGSDEEVEEYESLLRAVLNTTSSITMAQDRKSVV